jgi:hypothetical protein
MKILVMHQVPYRKIQYHLGIDHEAHDVAYFGTPETLAQLPTGLRARRVPLAGPEPLAAQIIAATSPTEGFERVLALSEFGILEAADIRAHLGIPGPDRARLELIRDKVAMKRALAAAGVAHPRFVETPSAAGPLPWAGKTVVKPRQGASSDGVSIHADARTALDHYWSLPERSEYELEEFIEGTLYHADGMVDQGAVDGLVVSRYIGTPAGFAAGAPVATSQLPYEQRFQDFAVRCVEALEISEGCIHLEFFDQADGQLVFLEIANRVGGAGVIDAYLRHTGIHLPSHEIAIRLGFPRPEPRPASGRYHGFALLPGHQLVDPENWDVYLPEELRANPCVDRVHTQKAEPPSGSSASRITYQEWQVPMFVEASHSDPATLASFLRACQSTMRLREIADLHV